MASLTPAHLTILRRALRHHHDFLNKSRRYGSQVVDKEQDAIFDLEEWIESDEIRAHFGASADPNSTTQGQ